MARSHIAASLDTQGPNDWLTGNRGQALVLSTSDPNGVVHHGPISAVLDGRFDDRANLVRSLGARPRQSDAELLLLAWNKWGQRAPEFLLGDYAFVVSDSRENTLFCARDHIGARPVFYAQSGPRFVVGSTAEQVLAAPFINDSLDMDIVASKIARNKVWLPDRTFFQNVCKLPPAHCMMVSANGVKLRQYWQPHDAAKVQYRRDEEYAEALRALIEQAVSDRTPATKPVGVHLSGGLDCGSIAAVATRIRRGANAADPIGYSWSPPTPTPHSDLEQSLVDAVAGHLGIRVEQPGFDADMLTDLILADGLFAPGVGYLLHELPVQKAASQRGISVILSGWGGDEVASHNGALAHSDMLLSGQWRAFARLAKRDNRSIARAVSAVAKTHFYTMRLSKKEQYFPRVAPYLNPALRAQGRKHPAPINYAYNTKARMAATLNTGELTRRIEDWAQSGLAHGIEYRYPLLDRRILEFGLGAPSHLFRKDGAKRWLMRSAIDPLLPDNVVWNFSKLELGRTGYLVDVINQMLPAIAPLLDSPSRDQSRDGWVDIAAIKAQLSAGLPKQKPRIASLLGALQMIHLKSRYK